MEIKISTRWNLGKVLWLKIEPDMKGLLTGLIVRPECPPHYLVTWNSGDETMHYGIELTDEKPVEFEKGDE
jgi:hypothetical protein